jgi:hypothetical protein
MQKEILWPGSCLLAAIGAVTLEAETIAADQAGGD